MNIKFFLDKIGITYLIDLFNNLFVHKTKDEIIDGQKTFIGKFNRTNSTYTPTGIILRNKDITRGIIPTADKYTCIVFADSNSDEWNDDSSSHGRTGTVETGCGTNGDVWLTLATYRNITNSGDRTALEIISTADGQKLARLVTGGSFTVKYSAYTRGTAPSSILYSSPLKVEDKTNDKPLYMIYGQYETNRQNWAGLLVYKGTDTTNTYTRLSVGYDGNGNIFSYAPTPATSSNDTNIATTAYVKSNLSSYVTLSSAQTISGVKTFSSMINSSAGIKLTASNNAIKLNSGGNGMCISAGDNNFDGATLQMFGRTNSSYPGRFYLRASTKSSSGSSGDSKDLVGWPNGSLSWTGSAIQYSSDERLKTSFNHIPDEILEVWDKVNWGEFKYLADVEVKGESARLHTGLIAQHVDNVFKDNNLDILKYGILCHDEHVATDVEPATDLWMVRYTEALAMEAAYQRRENQKLKDRISTLEEEIKLLKEAILNK